MKEAQRGWRRRMGEGGGGGRWRIQEDERGRGRRIREVGERGG